MNLILRGVGLLPRAWIKSASRLQWRHPLAKRAFNAVADRMRHRDGEIQQGIGKGLRFNSGASVAGFMLGTTEIGLQSAFGLFVRPNMTVFDVGANVGFYSTISARLVGSEGKVVAFEPLPANVKMITHNARMNAFKHISVQDLALGKEDGEAQFVISSDPNWGRLASLEAPDAVVGEQTVRVARIDSLVRDKHVPAPGLMKIDVEGAEVDVLLGASETLEASRPILFVDLHGTNAAIADILAKHRYEARVLGGGNMKLTDARWDAEVIAIPKERTELMGALGKMATWTLKD